MPVTFRVSLDIGLQTIHVNGTVVLVFVLSFIMTRRQMRRLLLRPDALLQLPETGHVWREAVGFPRGAWRRWLEAVLLVGHHLLDADHGFGLTDKRNL